MKTVIKLFGLLVLLFGGHLLLSSYLVEGPLHVLNGARISLQALNGTRLPSAFRLPYRQAGLTERQAAAHLLSRFTYGAMPGQVDAVVQQGLENWFLQQLA